MSTLKSQNTVEISGVSNPVFDADVNSISVWNYLNCDDF